MEELVPSEFYLSQNSPNPFRESTKIKYCLPIKSKVNLVIYNSDNKKIKKIISKVQEAGTYEIKIDSRDLLDDYYHYEFKAIGLPLGLKKVFKEMKRMILMK
jgi:hypothetical protein